MKRLSFKTILIIVALVLSSLTQATEVTCLPQGKIYGHAFSAMNNIIAELQISEAAGRLVNLKNHIDPFIFGGDILELNRSQLLNMASAVNLNYLVEQVNQHCQGNLFQSLYDISSKQCYLGLGLLELKIYGQSISYPQNNNDQNLRQCEPQEFMINSPYYSKSRRG